MSIRELLHKKLKLTKVTGWHYTSMTFSCSKITETQTPVDKPSKRQFYYMLIFVDPKEVI